MKTDAVFKRAFNHALDLVSELGEGRALPSENALSARLGVSRTTVRKVISALGGDRLADLVIGLALVAKRTASLAC